MTIYEAPAQTAGPPEAQSAEPPPPHVHVWVFLRVETHNKPGTFTIEYLTDVFYCQGCVNYYVTNKRLYQGG